MIDPWSSFALAKRSAILPSSAPEVTAKGFQVLVIFQNLFSITCVFSSASRCAIISKSSDGPKRPDFGGGKK
jgi:hypothetical protein